MGANQHTGLTRVDLTGLTYTYAQPSYKIRKLNPPSFASMDRTYGDALYSRDWEEAPLQLWQGGHTQVAYLRHLEGSFPTGGEFVEPFSI
jgi:hypothetical protein